MQQEEIRRQLAEGLKRNKGVKDHSIDESMLEEKDEPSIIPDIKREIEKERRSKAKWLQSVKSYGTTKEITKEDLSE